MKKISFSICLRWKYLLLCLLVSALLSFCVFEGRRKKRKEKARLVCFFFFFSSLVFSSSQQSIYLSMSLCVDRDFSPSHFFS
ncbi:hypothetical protein CSUI_011127 [Cystoisospora suis]|uniref:Transmembrane protein n=1 Tax=Cystoisospora suis TaxID=483139 RepID=A0A2C6J715_9APIC|nr:hypothetical protein CSUI_011127 [Cystoisospora suis]